LITSHRQLRWLNRVTIAATSVVLAVASSLFLLKQAVDQRWLAERARAITVHAVTREDSIKALQRYVRSHIDYTNAPIEGRPFLRASARQTLESGVGYCGEATRAYIALAHALEIPAKRVNLHGSFPHVVPEVELSTDRWVLVEIQDSPNSNPLLDGAWKTTDEVVSNGAYREYSNLNLRRIPLLNRVVRRVQLDYSWLTWLVENPSLMKAIASAVASVGLLFVLIVDAVLLRHYARRLSQSPLIAKAGKIRAAAVASADRG
jgi:hypothetical protein